MIQYHQSFLTAKLDVSDIDTAALFQFTGVAGLSTVNHVQTLSIGWVGKGDRSVLVSISYCDGRHKNAPVRVDESSLVNFNAAYNNAIFRMFHNVDKQIGIHLLLGNIYGPACHPQ